MEYNIKTILSLLQVNAFGIMVYAEIKFALILVVLLMNNVISFYQLVPLMV